LQAGRQAGGKRRSASAAPRQQGRRQRPLRQLLRHQAGRFSLREDCGSQVWEAALKQVCLGLARCFSYNQLRSSEAASVGQQYWGHQGASLLHMTQSKPAAAFSILTFDDVLLQNALCGVTRHGRNLRRRVVTCGTQAMSRSAACESHATIHRHVLLSGLAHRAHDWHEAMCCN